MTQYLTLLLIFLIAAVFNSASADDETDWDYSDSDFIDPNDCKEKGSSYCTDIRNYPDDIDNLIADKYKHFKTFFNQNIKPENVTSFRSREDEGELLCHSQRRTIYPKAAQDAEFNWVTIINTDAYKQGVDIVECTNDGEICGETNGVTVPHQYSVVCQQGYVHRALLGYRGNVVISSKFRFPSCCKCVLVSEVL